MFDFRFDWDNSIATGNEEIDSHNKVLFRIGRDIEQLILTDCRAASEKDLLAKLCEIREYMTYHFYTEEKILKENNFVGFEAHKARHEDFKRFINAVDCTDLVERPTQELKKIRNFLQDWVFSHIMLEDKSCFSGCA